MQITFLTPLGALFALTALLPLGVLRARERRLGRVRAVLLLGEPSRASRRWLVVSLIAVCCLIALAAAQPVVATNRVVRERTDAQVFLVLDTSRSMLASAKPSAPNRLERARSIARGLAGRLPEVPVGLASMTDRLLPHLFPTTDRRLFTATLEKAMSIESPGPSNYYTTQATTFDALVAARTLNYFPQRVTKRVLVVLTDGETRPVEEDLARAFRRKPRIETLFVRFWGPDERIYLTGVAEFGYSPNPGSGAALAGVASLVEGRVFSEDDSSKLRDAIVAVLGSGPSIDRRHEGKRRALMPWITLAAFLPLGLALWRRNL